VLADAQGIPFYYMDLGSGIMKENMKYTTVKISEILKHPTLRLDPKYWIKRKKNKKKASSIKQQASSLTVTEG